MNNIHNDGDRHQRRWMATSSIQNRGSKTGSPSPLSSLSSSSSSISHCPDPAASYLRPASTPFMACFHNHTSICSEALLALWRLCTHLGSPFWTLFKTCIALLKGLSMLAIRAGICKFLIYSFSVLGPPIMSCRVISARRDLPTAPNRLGNTGGWCRADGLGRT